MPRVPVANWLLIAATVAVSVADWGGWLPSDRVRPIGAVPPGITDPQIRRLIEKANAAGSEVSSLALRRDQFAPWQLATCLFVHGNLGHLLGNMLFLFVFGNVVNAKLGHWQFLLAYFALGAVAGLGWLLLGHGDAGIGASGAIAGIAGLFLVFYPINDVIIYDEIPLMTSGEPWRFSAVWFLLAHFAFDLIGTLILSGGIAYVAHLAGELTGVAAGIVLLKMGYYEPDRGERNLLQCLGLAEDERSRTPRRRR